MEKRLLDSILKNTFEFNKNNVILKNDLEKDLIKSRRYYRNEGIIFKPSKNTDEKGTYIKQEYEKLHRLYTIDPEHTVKPYALVLDTNNNSLDYLGYFMEFVEGMDLSDYMIDHNTRNKARDRFIMYQIKEAVSKFHSNGDYHGDIHENNIRITENYNIKIIDPYIWEKKSNRSRIKLDNEEVRVLSRLMYNNKNNETYLGKPLMYG